MGYPTTRGRYILTLNPVAPKSGHLQRVHRTIIYLLSCHSKLWLMLFCSVIISVLYLSINLSIAEFSWFDIFMH